MDSLIFKGNSLFKTDDRYKHVYEKLSSYKFTNNDIFLLTLILGYRSGESSDYKNNYGAEFRPSYFNEDQKSLIYAISFDIYGEELKSNLNNNDFIKDLKVKLNSYSNKGMEILLNEVFSDNMLDNKFISSYDDYDLDLLKYIYDELNAIPF